jgi:tRNA-dihydrouridine synthase
MLARGALGNPWLFEEVVAEWLWVLDRAEEHLGPERAARYLRKFHPWYVETLGEGRALQDALQRAESLDDQRSLIAGAGALPCAAALT